MICGIVVSIIISEFCDRLFASPGIGKEIFAIVSFVGVSLNILAPPR
jgi:hypothetical protein